MAAGDKPHLCQKPYDLRLIELQKSHPFTDPAIAREVGFDEAHGGREKEVVGPRKLQKLEGIAQRADIAGHDIGEEQTAARAQLLARDDEKVRQLALGEILHDGVGHDQVDRSGRQPLDFLRRCDADLGMARVAREQPFTHPRCAVAQVEMAAGVREPICRERLAAAVVDHPCVGSRQVA